MLLHIFGDTHGPLEINKINPKRFLGRALNDNDAIVICGDFGFPFLPTDCIPEDTLKESGAERYCIKGARAYRQNIDWLKSFPCNILFVDGNHDNHEFWAKLPTESWNGGQVQRLPDAPNVIHLMRGEYYTIDGLTVWCMDGEEHSYQVAQLETLAETAVKEMTAGDYPLTLFTCDYSGQARIAVRCQLNP